MTAKTVQKWVVESDREMDTSVWLRYDKVDREYVTMLKCRVCAEFNEKLREMHNHNPAFVVSSKNLRVSSYKDHAATDMYKRAMLLFKKQSSTDVTEYVPIAKALYNLDADTELKLKQKFDIAYMIAKHNLAFIKMKPLCELEEGIRWTWARSTRMTKHALPLWTISQRSSRKSWCVHRHQLSY